MKKIVTVIVVLGLGMFSLAGNLYAEDTRGLLPQLELEASATMDAYSRYVWRGFTLDTDPVFQPGFNISGYGLTLSFWGSFDADNNDTLNSDEVDFIVDYTKEYDHFSFSIGNASYNFPGTDTYSEEVYLGIAFSDVFLSPSLTYYYDYGNEEHGGADGEYINLGITYSLIMIEEPQISLDLAASVGYNDELFIQGQGGDYLISAGLTSPLAENLTCSAVIAYAIPFGDLNSSTDGNQKNRFYSGFSLGFSF